jgi:hypothetical protein
MGLYSVYGYMQNRIVTVHTYTIKDILANEDCKAMNEKLPSFMESVEGASQALSINIKIIWFLIMVNIIVSVWALIKTKKKT